MRLPLSWLNDFVKVDDIDPKELAEKLTRAGLQVEAIETVGGNPLSDLIVVAEVLECEQHPNRLRKPLQFLRGRRLRRRKR